MVRLAEVVGGDGDEFGGALAGEKPFGGDDGL